MHLRKHESGGMFDRFTEHADRLTVEILGLAWPADVDKVVGRTFRSGPVDIVVNNAGYAVVGAAEEMTVEQLRDQIEAFLLAPMVITVPSCSRRVSRGRPKGRSPWGMGRVGAAGRGPFASHPPTRAPS
ncbi:Rossmann-fold NAD(P)-binding domain-containing protein [Streptomyces blattellae]|uniref:hypothetical protein n=1 Tax=Streptomyces blattellae TaxID=2569855 RepID=UPI001E449A59|nr:hypothetical protein [Streptomyces blattellae]